MDSRPDAAAGASPGALRYLRTIPADDDGALLTLKLRYKEPDGSRAWLQRTR